MDLIPGDVVILSKGDKVPADIRLFSSDELYVDESVLTGESIPVLKSPELLKQDTLLGDRKNMLYTGTFIIDGYAKGIVVETGQNTVIGHIANMIASADVFDTPLTVNIKKISNILMWVILILTLITFCYGVIIDNRTIPEMFSYSIALAVGMIPEGLPAIVTIILAFGVYRMSKFNAIVRKLPVVETLGSASVICTDKTGTLTENKMTVKKIFAGGMFYDVEGVGYSSIGKVINTKSLDTVDMQKVLQINPALDSTIISGILCNDSSVKLIGNEFVTEGNPTETSLLIAAYK